MDLSIMLVIAALVAAIWLLASGVGSMAVDREVGHMTSGQWIFMRVAARGAAVLVAVAATLFLGASVAQAQDKAEKPEMKNFPELVGLKFTGAYEVGINSRTGAFILIEGAGEGGMKAKFANFPRVARYCASESYVGRQVPTSEAGVLLQFEVSLPVHAECGGVLKLTAVSEKEVSGTFTNPGGCAAGCKITLTR